MRLVFAGTPVVAVPALDALAASGHEIVAVVTRPDAIAGRGGSGAGRRGSGGQDSGGQDSGGQDSGGSGSGRGARRSPVGTWADERGIEVLTPARPGDPDFQARLRAIEPDCVPVVAYGALVPPAALAIPRYGWINLHFSLLPAWRGAAPVQHAIRHGDEVTGVSVFQLDAGLDTGGVFGTVTEEIRPGDTAGDLLDRLAVAGAALLVRVLDAIEAGVIEAVAQPVSGVSLAPKILVEDAEIRWAEPAFAVDRRIRSCTPEPGAWTTLRGERIKLGPVRVTHGAPRLVSGQIAPGPIAPGRIVVERARVLVGTGTDPVELGEVRPAGKKPMAAPDWARGARLEPDSSLGPAATGVEGRV